MKKVVESLLNQYRIEHIGFARLETPLSLSFYQNWLEQSYHGDMSYLKNHLPQKTEPQKLLAGAQSAIVFTYPYSGDEWSSEFPLSTLKVASYAKRKDYHFWLKSKINSLCIDLKKIFPEHDFLGFTDSAPVMERDLAHRAGLGWFGKNSCLIDKKKGSLFFIGEIYTSLPTEPLEKLPVDHCGTCRRCIDSCPTDAILENRSIDATKCISYWTIESKNIPPKELRPKIQDWFFGCDVCQDVCPWNSKITRTEAVRPSPQSLTQELKWILTSSNKQLEKIFKETPLARSGGRGLKRNAMIVAANLKVKEILPELAAFKEDARLAELAQWAIDSISSEA